MGILLTTIVAALTWAGERMLDAGLSTIRNRLQNNAASEELGKITERAIEEALRVAPSLAEDFRSGPFIQGVAMPVVMDSLEHAAPADATVLSDAYVERFVAPWVADRGVEGALAQTFQTDRPTLDQAMAAFTNSLRAGLLTSEYWRDVGRDQTLVAIHDGVSSLLAVQARSTGADALDLATARADSKVASQDLLEWQRTISGLFMARPELDLLIRRIHTEPRGRTLLVGEGGSGKSALLSELTERLQNEGMIVFAVKADMLPADAASISDLSRALGIHGDLDVELQLLARSGPVVLVIDQLDAVSDVMDRSSQRMKLLLRIANSFSHDRRFEDGPPVHVLVSSRPFEAAHDGRFQSLGAETIKLGLPSLETVKSLLADLGIDSATVPESLQETVRRPFALRLFVELVQRGVDVSQVSGAELLNVWLLSANLGDDRQRPEVIGFLERLAGAMTDTETLWRPADAFDQASLGAVKLAEASGLIVRQDGQLGFSHQSWLDDFQAKAFADGQALAAFAWDRQDGLFARATVLRGLERLRRYDVRAYETALDLLLGQGKTRRHLRHLVVDVVASQDAPTAREQGWIKHIFGSDMALTRRAAGKLADRWSGWRDGLVPLLPALMKSPDLKWVGHRLLQAEALVDADAATDIIRGQWGSEAHDLDVFEIAWRAKLWNPWIATRVREILDRHDVQDFAVSGYIENLLEADRADAAVELVRVFLVTKPAPARRRFKLHDIGKLVKASPVILAQELTPWFIDLVADAGKDSHIRDEFPSAHKLPYDWNWNDDEDNVYCALRSALALAAKTHPNEILKLVADLSAVEAEEAQALAADTLAENVDEFCGVAFDFLLADPRRMAVGGAHLDDEDGVGHSVSGWSSKQLISAIGSRLDEGDLQRLKASIDVWERYRPERWEDWSAKERKMRREWEADARMELLDRLPDTAFTPRELRQVREWRARQPVLKNTGRMTAYTVGAPMSVEQMAKAGDDALLGLLNECHDGTDWGERRSRKRRHMSRSGGAIQVGRAFAALGKEQPERVLRLIRERLSPERHQYAAGCAIHEMSALETVDPHELVELIRELFHRGFSNDDWRRDASWAFQRLAHRLNGLETADLELIESWIEDDANLAATRTARRLELEASNRERNKDKGGPKTAHAVVFGHHFGRGMGSLPQDNYSHLSAIAAGLLGRDPVDSDGWLSVLERHADRADDPHIWETVLAYHGRSLFWADRSRVEALFQKLWERFPAAFTVTVGGQLWNYRAMIPKVIQLRMLEAWSRSEDLEDQQAAGEIAAASLLVDGEDDPLAPIANNLLDDSPSPGQLGAIFTGSAAWRGNAGAIRDRSHALLMRFALKSEGDIAEAVSTALDSERTLLADEATKELLKVTVENKAVLSAALNGRFADALQSLMLHPGFDEIVLEVAEKCVDRIVDDTSGGRGFDNDFVAIAIALQRAPDPYRGRAMNLYERLLDADVYGADQAAKATLRN